MTLKQLTKTVSEVILMTLIAYGIGEWLCHIITPLIHAVLRGIN